jgi:uncharacterized protein (DUF1499 family)
MKKSILSIIPLISACAGEPVHTLGVRENKLAPCPASPNCVSSFEENNAHNIHPIAANLDQIAQVIVELTSANIVNASENYLHVEFTSRIMRYVDDVEFLYSKTKNITHVRSASRVGYSDFGVNRKRVEKIRELIKK